MKQAGTATVPAIGPFSSARELPFLRKWTESKPALHGRGQLPASRQHHLATGTGCPNSIEPHPDRCHGAQIDGYIEIDIEARIDRAEIDTLLRIDDQPPQTLRRRKLG